MTKKKDKPYLVYAIAPNGAMAHIDSVPNGMGCGCICPHCKDKLLAKNGGSVNAHHFAHRDGADCVGAIESALHLLAKEVLSETLRLMLPNGDTMSFDRVVKEEYNSELSLRPDCVGYYGDKLLWIEFKRTHAVDARKEEKIVSAHVDCIEIDLNECEQDKEKVRTFVTQSIEKRKWIYSAKYGKGISNRRNRSKDRDERDPYDDWEESITRHFAIEDGVRLIDLDDIEKFDALHHKYTCPSCGKEVVLRVGKFQDYYFEHLYKGVSCDDEMYLKKSAVAALYQAYSESEHFIINITQYHKCKLHDTCKLTVPECEAGRTHPYDLKKYGYTCCRKEYRFDDAIYQTDLVFCKGDSLENAIEAFVCTENIDMDIATSRRMIRISVRDEEGIRDLLAGNLSHYNVMYYGFKENGDELAEPQEINRGLVKFIFYSSGRFYPKEIKCTETFASSHKTNILKEVIFTRANGQYGDMRNYLLFRCKEQGLGLCYCYLCFFLAKSNGYYGDGRYYCKRYKTKGTPQYPLDAKPVDCPYFMLDNNIKARIKSVKDQMEVIELSRDNS